MIREITSDDYHNVADLWKRTPEVGLFCNEDKVEIFKRYIIRNRNTSFVAENDGKIVGSIMAGHDGWLGFIHHLCVDTEYRGNKIGTQLVNAAISALKTKGITLVSLVVYEKNTKGNSFWEHMKFTTREDLIYRNLLIK